jgi:calcium permeable stress-gated cation channel
LSLLAISYSCIAPLVLGFAGTGLYIIYLVYKYNILYVYDSEIDTKGLVYPRAMMHLLVGLYLAEICLLGLFLLKLAIGPALLMLLFFIFTGLVHLALDDAVGPLMYNLPRTLALETDDQLDNGTEVANDETAEEQELYSPPTGWDDDIPPPEEESDDIHQGVTSTRGVEGASGLFSAIQDWSKDKLKERIIAEFARLKEVPLFSFLKTDSTAPLDPDRKPNFFLKWLHPEIYEDFSVLRHVMPLPTDMTAEEANATAASGTDLERRAYYPPAVSLPAPRLWIPRDDACVSRQEVAHSGKVIKIYDDGAYLNERGRVVVDMDTSPLVEPRILY